MVPSVDLDGTDTVEGLKTLDRLRAARLLDLDAPPKNNKNSKKSVSRRKAYKRYKGPFIECIGIDEFQRAPKPWSDFVGNSVAATSAAATFDVPASLDALFERVDENIVHYLANYLRVAAAILLLCTYLRPRAVLGIAFLVYNFYTTWCTLRIEVLPPSLPSPWIGILVMIYSKCAPIVGLAFLLSLLVISLHASFRRTASEMRRRPHGTSYSSYSFRQVWKGHPREARRLPQEGWEAIARSASAGVRTSWKWAKFYTLSVFDRICNPWTRRR